MAYSGLVIVLLKNRLARSQAGAKPILMATGALALLHGAITFAIPPRSGTPHVAVFLGAWSHDHANCAALATAEEELRQAQARGASLGRIGEG